MGEYFRGWKPKIGLATLMLACVQTVGWKFSHTQEDVVYATLRPGVHHTFSSRYNVVLWKVDTWKESQEVDPGAKYPSFSRQTTPIQFPETARHFLDEGMRHSFTHRAEGYCDPSGIEIVFCGRFPVVTAGAVTHRLRSATPFSVGECISNVDRNFDSDVKLVWPRLITDILRTFNRDS